MAHGSLADAEELPRLVDLLLGVLGVVDSRRPPGFVAGVALPRAGEVLLLAEGHVLVPGLLGCRQLARLAAALHSFQ